jgi:hypothetical protein
MARRVAGGIVSAFAVGVVAVMLAVSSTAQPAPGRPAPAITAGRWINSGPLSIDELRGRVVLVEFWTFG